MKSPLFIENRNNKKKKFLKDILIPNDYSIPISKKWETYVDFYTNKISKNNIKFKLTKTRKRLERKDQGVNLKNCVFQIRSSGIRAISINKPFPTFAVSHSGGGAMIPVYSKERRHLSINEIKKLMGFKKKFKFPVSRTDSIKQLSNAVCPDVVKNVGLNILKVI